MRMMNYFNRFDVLGCFCTLNELNEMSDKTFDSIRRLGDKIGLKIHKSNTLFSILKKAGKNIEDLLRYASLYATIDMGDEESRKELENDMKQTLKHVNKKELADFFLQLDNNTLHLTAIPRHILSSLFGIHVSTYHEWKEEKDYILDSLRKILEVMNGLEKKSLHDLSNEREMIMKIQSNISEL
jgi:hypothetical protein